MTPNEDRRTKNYYEAARLLKEAKGLLTKNSRSDNYSERTEERIKHLEQQALIHCALAGIDLPGEEIGTLESVEEQA